MRTYALRRLLVAIPMLVVIAIVTFGLLRIAPGDPVTTLLGPEASDPEVVAAARAEYRLDDPLPVQFWTWISNAAAGDFGKSITARRPVLELILERLPATLELALMALAISIVAGVLLGVASALHQRRALDSVVRVGSLFGVSVPGFVIGIVLLMIFGLYAPGILPVDDWVDFSENPIDNLAHAVLPALALAAAPAGLIARQVRSSMLDVLSREYIAVARGLGVSRRRIIWLDALKNALLPSLALLGVIFTYLVGGSVPIESIFNVPGSGRLLADALTRRDYPLVSGLVFVLSVVVVLMSVLIDIIYGWVNPRIAASYGAGR